MKNETNKKIEIIIIKNAAPIASCNNMIFLFQNDLLVGLF